MEIYATERGIEIVRQYMDEGKSGLRIKGRTGLLQLIEDVQTGEATFGVILVHDVTRWGRFQDVDESAYYEYVCRSHGIDVVYCAEQFQNDGSPLSSILKSLKRAMAAEYSRELSEKVFMAQCEFTALGFKQGGTAGYALRRATFGADGRQKKTLELGERKGALTDRVQFALGPAHEVAVVRRIYKWYVTDGLGDTAIAARLNELAVPSETTRPWTAWLIRGILTNEKYLGNLVFNRRSFKLSRDVVHNPAEEWIRRNDQFPALITHALFDRAAEVRRRRQQGPTDDELLEMLRRVFRKHGRITSNLITEFPGIPNAKLFGIKFGSLLHAYTLAGVDSATSFDFVTTRRAIRSTLLSTISKVRMLIDQAGGTARLIAHPGTLLINEAVTVKIVVARARIDIGGNVRWKIPTTGKPPAHFTIALQMEIGSIVVRHYYLFPLLEPTGHMITLRGEDPGGEWKFRHDSLEAMFGLPARPR
ncbi:recombinase family protein [Massilia sp. CCM 8693]|uniref:Recombinase family protein n=2 Tax=Massilia aquatica TaxID=2609000 RepID=A0ABX0MJ13_9BURK|nr:recombinase family protein [Massilia aquatica]